MKGFFPKILVIFLCAAIALSLAACSDGDKDGGDAGTTPPPDSGSGTGGNSDSTGGTPTDPTPADPTPEEPQKAELPGHAFAAEADPLGAVLNNIRAAVTSWAAASGFALGDEHATVYDPEYDVLFGEDLACAYLYYSPGPTIWAGWRVDTGALAYLHVDAPQDTDAETLADAVYSDDTVPGLSEAVALCREAEPLPTVTGEAADELLLAGAKFKILYDIRSAGQAALFTSERSFRLYFPGSELMDEDGILYFTDGDSAVVYGLDYAFAARPKEERQSLFIPDTMGGLPVRRIRLSLCDGWNNAMAITWDSWFSVPATVRDVDIETNYGNYVLPEALERLTFTFHLYARRTGDMGGFTSSKILCLSRGAKVLPPDGKMTFRGVVVTAYWDSPIAQFAKRNPEILQPVYMDSAYGSWEDTEAALSDRSLADLAILAGAELGDVEGLSDEEILSAVSREELMSFVKTAWEEDVGEPIEAPEAYKDALNKARQGDTADLVALLMEE